MFANDVFDGIQKVFGKGFALGGRFELQFHFQRKRSQSLAGCIRTASQPAWR